MQKRRAQDAADDGGAHGGDDELPERRETPAASSSASTRSLNPRDSANRVPNFVTSLGIQPVPCSTVPAADGWLPGRITARMRASTWRSFFALAALPSRNHTKKKAHERDDTRKDVPGRWGCPERAPPVRHQCAPFGSRAKSSASTYTPRSASLSRNFGRRPVDFSRPRKWPSSSIPGGEVEQEDVLERDDLALHARDLGHVGEAAGAVLQALLVHDQLDRRGDLLADRPRRRAPCPPSS